MNLLLKAKRTTGTPVYFRPDSVVAFYEVEDYERVVKVGSHIHLELSIDRHFNVEGSVEGIIEALGMGVIEIGREGVGDAE